MKTIRKSAILLLIALLFGVFNVAGQPVEKKKTPEQIFMGEIQAAFTAMILQAKEEKKESECDVQQILGPQVIPDTDNIGSFKFPFRLLGPPNDIVRNKLKPHSFNSDMEFVLDAMKSVKTFKQFVRRISTSSTAGLSLREADEFYEYYDHLTRIAKWMHSGTNKKLTHGACEAEIKYFVRVSKYAYPLIHFELKTVVEIECDCKRFTSPNRFNTAKFEYTAKTVGTITKDIKSFGKALDPKLKLLNHKCCPELEEKEKDHGMHIEDEKPAYYVGLNGGFGFSDEFDATGFCLTADYVHHMADVGNGGLYIGGGAGYETMSGTDFQMNGFMVGPTAELFTPINDSGNLLWINGVSGYYSFGDREVFGFKSTYTGFDAVFRSGLNFRISSSVMVGVEIPIITWKQRTFKDDMRLDIMDPYGEGVMFESNEQKQSGFDFLLNNGNPVKLGFRFTF